MVVLAPFPPVDGGGWGVQGVRLALEPGGDVEEGFCGGNELAGEKAGDLHDGPFELDV